MIAVLLLTTTDEKYESDNLLRKKYCIDDYWTLFSLESNHRMTRLK